MGRAWEYLLWAVAAVTVGTVTVATVFLFPILTRLGRWDTMVKPECVLVLPFTNFQLDRSTFFACRSFSGKPKHALLKKGSIDDSDGLSAN